MWLRRENDDTSLKSCVVKPVFTNCFSALRAIAYCTTSLLVILAACERSGESQYQRLFEVNSTGFHSDTSWMNQTLNRISEFDITSNDSIAYYLDSIINLAGNYGLTNTVASAYFQVGIHNYRQNKYPEAREYFEKAILLAKKSDDTLLLGKSLQVLGSLALTMGDDNLCLKLNYEALPLFEKTNYLDGIARVYNIIGLYKSGQNDYDSAISYYSRAMEINRQIGNQTGLIHNRGNLAYLYEKMGRFEEAESTYLELEAELIDIGDSLNLPVIYSDLASVKKRTGQIKKAGKYLRKAVGILENTKDSAGLGPNYGDLGETYYAIKQYDSAKYFLGKSAVCAKTVHDPETEAMALKYLIKLDSVSSDWKAASLKYKQLVLLNDSIFARKYRNHLKASELQYENQKKKLLIESQEINLTNALAQKRMYTILLVLSAVLLALITTVVIFYFRNIHEKQQLIKNQLIIKSLGLDNAAKTEEIQKLKIEKIEESLKIKELEQVSQALVIEQKNELLSIIYNNIKTYIRDKGQLDIRELNAITSKIRAGFSDSEDSDLFNQKFNQVHPGFYKSLVDAHANLSKSELKFCAYIRLNLTGHQIANIMNVSNEAIRKNRYRIRKKLDLAPNDSLEEYLSRF